MININQVYFITQLLQSSHDIEIAFCIEFLWSLCFTSIIWFKNRKHFVIHLLFFSLVWHLANKMLQFSHLEIESSRIQYYWYCCNVGGNCTCANIVEGDDPSYESRIELLLLLACMRKKDHKWILMACDQQLTIWRRFLWDFSWRSLICCSALSYLKWTCAAQ